VTDHNWGLQTSPPYVILLFSEIKPFTKEEYVMRLGNPGGKFSTKVVPGAIFGRLTVVERLPKIKGRYKVLCKCKCGQVSAPNVDALLGGWATSCGCRKRECLAENRNNKLTPGKGYSLVVRGARFGRLVVIKRIEERRVKCKCDCGNESVPFIDGLIGRKTKSCGCLHREITINRNKETAKFQSVSTSHKLTHKTWRSLLHRITKDKNYEGVKVCKQLWNSPWGIINTIGDRTIKDQTLDRFPLCSGNYTCGQCDDCKQNGWELNIRWATVKEQNNNKRNNVFIEAFGKRLTRTGWEHLTGLDETRIARRIKELGWSVEKALTTPDKRGNCYKPELAIKS
jgi:hypothetical protein